MTKSMIGPRRQHPSGKPIERRKWGERSIPRVPRDEYLTPRLNRRQGAYAVGFATYEVRDDDDE